MRNGYRVTHPKIDVYFDVLLNREELAQIQNLLAEIGEGGKVIKMSDLLHCFTFDYVANELRNYF